MLSPIDGPVLLTYRRYGFAMAATEMRTRHDVRHMQWFWRFRSRLANLLCLLGTPWPPLLQPCEVKPLRGRIRINCTEYHHRNPLVKKLTRPASTHLSHARRKPGDPPKITSSALASAQPRKPLLRRTGVRAWLAAASFHTIGRKQSSWSL